MIYIERFWRTIKPDYVNICLPRNGIELSLWVKEYVVFYNFKNKHQGLGRVEPAKLYLKAPVFKQGLYYYISNLVALFLWYSYHAGISAAVFKCCCQCINPSCYTSNAGTFAVRKQNLLPA
jgi:hypothetical protein